MNVYFSMDAAIILYNIVSDCCLSVYLNIFLLTTGLRKMVLGSWKSPGFFLTKSENPACYTSRIQSYKECSKVVINVTHERTSSILPICIHQRLQMSKKRMYFRNCYTCGEVTSQNLLPRYDRHFVGITCLQCFDAVGWAVGRASGL